MTNQVFLLMKVHYEKTGQIVSPEKLKKLNMDPDYVVEGILKFDAYLDERREESA